MISIVIPLYNKGHVIINTLNSVFAQSFNDFEIIIINDGSQDNGVEVINKTFHDPRLRIFSQENQGTSVARDRGVKESRYKYIAFLDADDEWHPDYLAIMSEVINDNPNAALYSSGGIIRNADKSEVYRIANKYINYKGVTNFFENPFWFTHTSATIINKDFFNKTSGSPVGMRCLQDFALFVQLALLGDFVYVGLPISKYIGGVSGQTTSVSEEKRFLLLQYVNLFYNLSYQKWKEAKMTNKTFHTFIKYDIRNRFKFFLKKNDEKSCEYFLANLDNNIKKEFYPFEIYLYRTMKNRTAILWINFTKLIWRCHHYPIAGEKVDINKIPAQYRNW